MFDQSAWDAIAFFFYAGVILCALVALGLAGGFLWGVWWLIHHVVFM